MRERVCARAFARSVVEHVNYHYYYYWYIQYSNVCLSSLKVPQANGKKLNVEKKHSFCSHSLRPSTFFSVCFHLGVVFFQSSFLSVCSRGNSISRNMVAFDTMAKKTKNSFSIEFFLGCCFLLTVCAQLNRSSTMMMTMMMVCILFLHFISYRKY